MAGADEIIVDLEDAVPPAQKDEARLAVKQQLSTEKPVVVRINGADTTWFSQDVKLLGTPGIAGVMLPKAESPEQIKHLSDIVPKHVAILPLIETARGFHNMEAIAGTGRVQRLVFGSIDFQLDMGISGEKDELLYFRSHFVLVSRLADLMRPVDGVSVAIDDREGLRSDALRARRLGFGGKLCIHPKQVPDVNAAFSPTPEDVAWAKRVVQAAAEAHGAAAAVDGKMVDRPVILRAEEILRQIT